MDDLKVPNILLKTFHRTMQMMANENKETATLTSELVLDLNRIHDEMEPLGRCCNWSHIHY
jgi:hypothetical protein